MPAPERRPDSNGARSPGSRHRAGWFGRWLLRMLNVIAVASLVAAPAAWWPATAHESEAAVGAPAPFQPYVVHLAEPNALVEGNAPAADLVARAHQHQRDEVGAALDALRASGRAGQHAYDDAGRSFRVSLSADAASDLASHPGLTVDRDLAGAAGASTPSSGAPTGTAPSATTRPSGGMTAQDATTVSSVNYIQVYSPFMWGHVSIGGLAVTI